MNRYENAVDWSISSYNAFLLMKPTLNETYLKENFSFNQMRLDIAKFDTHLKAKL